MQLPSCTFTCISEIFNNVDLGQVNVDIRSVNKVTMVVERAHISQVVIKGTIIYARWLYKLLCRPLLRYDYLVAVLLPFKASVIK